MKNTYGWMILGVMLLAGMPAGYAGDKVSVEGNTISIEGKAPAPGVKDAAAPAPAAVAVVTDADVQDARLKTSCFSVAKGLYRDQVEQAAVRCGFTRVSKHSEIKAVPGLAPEWIFEYEYKNDTRLVKKTVMFESNKWTVLRTSEVQTKR